VYFVRLVPLALAVSLVSCGEKVEKAPVAQISVRTNSAPPPLPREALKLTEPDPNERHSYLELVLLNSTADLIDETEVVFGKQACAFGDVSAGVPKGVLGWTQPVGTNALVRWRDSAKTQRVIAVNIAGVYDPAVPGTLTFSVVGTNVTVGFQKLNR
jgi:hypothetical protein